MSLGPKVFTKMRTVRFRPEDEERLVRRASQQGKRPAALVRDTVLEKLDKLDNEGESGGQPNGS